MRWVAVGSEAVGFVAIGQQATGVIAIGQLALGVVSFGQLSRGVVAIGQLSCGGFAFGQLSLGAVWSGGMVAIAPTAGCALLPVGFLRRWVPWRRSTGGSEPFRLGPVRSLLAALCVGAVTMVTIVPLLDAFSGAEGVLRDPPPELR